MAKFDLDAIIADLQAKKELGLSPVLEAVIDAQMRRVMENQQRLMEEAILYGSTRYHVFMPNNPFMFTNQQEPPPPIEEKPMPPDGELPKQALLLKFLNLTNSDQDGEALTAIRKANAFLKANGWTWDMLLAAKIKIIADPFSGLGVPEQKEKPTPPPPPQRPAPQWSPPPRPRQQPPRLYPVGSTKQNSWANTCFCCGVGVPPWHGAVFIPSNYNNLAPVGDALICIGCNADSHLRVPAIAAAPRHFRQQTAPPPKPSPRPRSKRYDINDL